MVDKVSVRHGCGLDEGRFVVVLLIVLLRKGAQVLVEVVDRVYPARVHF